MCSLAGGVGRTTLAGLFALTLAGLPYAQLHRPIALGELDPSPLSRSRTRWGVPPDLDHIAVTPVGGRVRILADIGAPADGRPVRIIDSPAGLAKTLQVAATYPASSIVLLSRPDRASLADTAAALIWLQDVQRVGRDRLTVVVNHGVGPVDPGSKAAATALGIRCRSVHRFPAHTALKPGTPLPSGRQTPRALHRVLIRLCADVYNSTVCNSAGYSSTRPTASTSSPTLPEEHSHA
ncbi:MinD/ParA family ATP-binding protein [Microlunatus endophyticus]